MVKNSTQVQKYFKNHKNANELFFVNGMPFFREVDAKDQAFLQEKDGKKNVAVVRVTRDEAFAMATASEGSPEGEPASEGSNAGEPGAESKTPAEEVPNGGVEHVVADVDVEHNPELGENGIQAGDTVELHEIKTALQIAEEELVAALKAQAELTRFTKKEIKKEVNDVVEAAQAKVAALMLPPVA